MNAKQFLHLLIGLFIVVIGVFLGYKWEKEVVLILKGAIPLVIVGLGLMWALIGYIIAGDIE